MAWPKRIKHGTDGLKRRNSSPGTCNGNTKTALRRRKAAKKFKLKALKANPAEWKFYQTLSVENKEAWLNLGSENRALFLRLSK